MNRRFEAANLSFADDEAGVGTDAVIRRPRLVDERVQRGLPAPSCLWNGAGRSPVWRAWMHRTLKRYPS